MEKIRILHCIETMDSGGVEQCRLTLARMLPPQKYEQRILCTQAAGGLPPQFREAGCEIHETGVLRGIFDPGPYRRALAAVRDFKPHLIHGAVYEGVALAVVAGRLGQVPIILGEETSDPVDRRWKGQLLYRLLSAAAHHMVAVSPAVQQYLTARLGLAADKVTLINNGVDEPNPAPPAEVEKIRRRFGLHDEHIVIGTVGRLLDKCKRTSDLIRALALLKSRHSHIHLMVVGSGPDETMLRQLSKSFGVEKQVHFAGYQSETRAFYETMDIFALASANEAFGMVLVEAMFAGLPVVASRVGGIPSVVHDKVSGLLVNPLQPMELANALEILVNDAALRKTMGQNGRLRASTCFTADRYVREIDRLYSRLLAGTAVASGGLGCQGI